jgi:hypothetical protein
MAPADSSPCSAQPDEMETELHVMMTVGRALATLHDPAARSRVLRWAAERFQDTPMETVPSRAVSAPADPCLTVEDDLGDLFNAPSAFPHPEVHHAARDEPPLDSLVRGFVDDFQRVALEWQTT